MVRKALLAVLFLVPCVTLLAQETTTTSGFKVKAAGVQVVRDSYGKGFKGLTPFNSGVGSKVAIFVESPNGGLIEFVKQQSTIEAFADNQGNPLFTKIGFSEGFGSFPKISEDGKLAMIEFRGKKVPAAGSDHIHVKGLVAVLQAKTQKKIRSAVCKSAKGSPVKIGDYEFEISGSGKPSWGKMPFQLTLSIKKDIFEISKFRFFDKEGKPIESKSNGRSRSSGGSWITVTRSYKLAKKVDELIVEIDAYTDMKLHKVPVDLKVKLAPAAAKPESE